MFIAITIQRMDNVLRDRKDGERMERNKEGINLTNTWTDVSVYELIHRLSLKKIISGIDLF